MSLMSKDVYFITVWCWQGRGLHSVTKPFAGEIPKHEEEEGGTLTLWLRGVPWRLVSDRWVLAWPEGMDWPL